MSATVEFEINKQFQNYIVLIKNMSKDKEKCFYDAYGKNALVFGYIMKLKIRYRSFYISKTFKKIHYLDKNNGAEQKKQRVFTAYSGVPSYKLKEIIYILNFYHVNYIIIDKMQNYKITHIRQFDDNKYKKYYKKGLYYKRILRKMKNINEFLRSNSDSGEILYLIYDIERCIDDFCKRKSNPKELKNKNIELEK